jgi:glyoxylase-like metal-dependent hydrolase (beta-lactamase superfamily II)
MAYFPAVQPRLLPGTLARHDPGTQAAFKLITDRTTRIKPGAEIVSGIGTIESRGHTPGHMFILIASNGEQALVIGDAITNQLSASRTPTGSRAMGF